LRSSSEFDACNSSTRLREGYSRPITGVVSKYSYLLKGPFLLGKGFAFDVRASNFPGWTVLVVCTSASVADGAILNEDVGTWNTICLVVSSEVFVVGHKFKIIE
jgi:hypothetical protein